MKSLEDTGPTKIELTDKYSIFTRGKLARYIRDAGGKIFEVLDAQEPFKPVIVLIRDTYEPKKNEIGRWRNFESYVNLIIPQKQPTPFPIICLH